LGGRRGKQWELALMLVGVYQALFPLVGGNESQMRDWMVGHNQTLNRAPKDSILTVDGLASTLSYLRGISSLL